MKIAFKLRSIFNRSESAPNFRQNRVNGCILRADGPVSTMKQACIAQVAQNRANIMFNRRNISNWREITLSFRQNRVNDSDLRVVRPVSTLKQACIKLVA